MGTVQRSFREQLDADSHQLLPTLLGLEAGTLAEGMSGDVILIDEHAPWRIDADDLPGMAGNTPFDGLPVQGRVLAMWKGGRAIG